MKKIMHLILAICLAGMMTVSSLASERYVYDEAGILEEHEQIRLEEEAAVVAEKYGVGIYMITVDDYMRYSGSGEVFTTATELYHGLELGEGDDREGILLLLSMYDRDYATFFYGENVEYAFDSFGQSLVDDAFLDDFGEDRWYDGFHDYVGKCNDLLWEAAQGTPVRKDLTKIYIIATIIVLVLALLQTWSSTECMKSVRKGGNAAVYATGSGLNLTTRGDYFLYNTQTRRKIEKSSESKSHSGGGGSGRSGKF